MDIKDLTEKLREKTGDQDGDFPKAFTIEEGAMQSRHVLYFYYRKTKSDGSKTKKKYEMGVIMRYCPFTGKEL